MKKILSFVLCLVMLISVMTLAGCGSSSSSSSDTSATAAVAAETAAPATEAPATAVPAQKITIGVGIRSMSNPYEASLKEGAELFAKSLPEGTAEVQVLLCDGNDEKQINDVKAFVAKTGKNGILCAIPNQGPDAAEIAQICEDSGIYWTSIWNTVEGVYPTNYKYWVMHQTPDDSKSGYAISIEMFKKFKTPNKGKILAIQGMLSTDAAVNRFKGLQQALKENPDVKLLDQQSGDWNAQKALTIAETWLSKYSDIDGIWCANDDMAIAVIQALKAKGLNGKVQVVGVDGIADAVTAIKNGDMCATVSSDGLMQASYGVAYAYAALTGKIDTKTMDQAKRMINTKALLITKDNLAEYEKNYITSKPQFDFTNLDYIIEKTMDVTKK